MAMARDARTGPWGCLSCFFCGSSSVVAQCNNPDCGARVCVNDFDEASGSCRECIGSPTEAEGVGEVNAPDPNVDTHQQEQQEDLSGGNACAHGSPVSAPTFVPNVEEDIPKNTEGSKEPPPPPTASRGGSDPPPKGNGSRPEEFEHFDFEAGGNLRFVDLKTFVNLPLMPDSNILPNTLFNSEVVTVLQGKGEQTFMPTYNDLSCTPLLTKSHTRE